MVSEETNLEKKLITRIEREGPITFHDFMQTALYDADRGYYNTDRLKIGPAGDYYTSSNVHLAYGAVLARAFVKLWNEDVHLSQKPLAIVEMGAGTGRLALDVLLTMRDEHPSLFSRLSYVITETSPAMRNLQQKKLAPFSERVSWRGLSDLEAAPITGIVFSNELVDAMPVHRVRLVRGEIEESYVTLKTGSMTREGIRRLALTWGKPSTPRLAEYLERMAMSYAEGQIIEINLKAIDWLARSSRAIEGGYLITIDYGDLAGHLYGPERREGTLRSFYRHRLVDSPLERVGEQDITASVNFTALIEYGRDLGFETVSYERQSAFLLRMGLIDRMVRMESVNGGSMDDLKDRLAVKNLFVPGGVSDNYRVLIQKRVTNHS